MNMKYFALLFALLSPFLVLSQKKATVKIVNKTGQDIRIVKYFSGTSVATSDPLKRYSERAGMANGKSISIPLTFGNKKDRKVVIKAELLGGGETLEIGHTFENGEVDASPIDILITPGKIPTDPVKNIYDQFRKFKLDSNYIDLNTQNAYKTVIGAIFIYDKNALIDIISPEELKSTNLEIKFQGFNESISSIFTKKTIANASLSVPFVNASSDLDQSELCKYTWEIKSAGSVLWQTTNGTSYQQLFTQLSPGRLNSLYNTFIIRNKNLKAKFINRAYIIEKILIKKEYSRQLSSSTTIGISTFVTANGNFEISNEKSEITSVENIVTQIDGFDVTHLLENLALSKETDLRVLRDKYDEKRKPFPNLSPLPDNANEDFIKSKLADIDKMIALNVPTVNSTELKLGEIEQVSKLNISKLGEVINLKID